jgi:hypothetical protein
MADGEQEAPNPELNERRQQLEERRFEEELKAGRAEQDAKRIEQEAKSCQAAFERRYRLLELRERRADRALKTREIKITEGRGIKFTSGQATVAAATLALLSAVAGGVIQGLVTRNVEASKNQALVAVEELKAKGNLDLESNKQEATERLERAKFETTLILKATEAAKREDQIRNLKFFLNAGFIRDPGGKIAQMSEGAYPSSPPTSTLAWGDLPASMRAIKPNCMVTFSADPPSLSNIVQGVQDLLKKPPLSIASTQVIDRGYYQIATEAATLPLFAAQLGSHNTSIRVSKTPDSNRFLVDAVLPVEGNNYVLLGLKDYFSNMGASMDCPQAPGDRAAIPAR